MIGLQPAWAGAWSIERSRVSDLGSDTATPLNARSGHAPLPLGRDARTIREIRNRSPTPATVWSDRGLL